MFFSQNHQYALKLQDPFPSGWEPFFINCNDSSVEGIKSTLESGKKVWGVQFHPESAGGPLDTIEVGGIDTDLHGMRLTLPRCLLTSLWNVRHANSERNSESEMLGAGFGYSEEHTVVTSV